MYKDLKQHLKQRPIDFEENEEIKLEDLFRPFEEENLKKWEEIQKENKKLKKGKRIRGRKEKIKREREEEIEK